MHHADVHTQSWDSVASTHELFTVSSHTQRKYKQQQSSCRSTVALICCHGDAADVMGVWSLCEMGSVRYKNSLPHDSRKLQPFNIIIRHLSLWS